MNEESNPFSIFFFTVKKASGNKNAVWIFVMPLLILARVCWGSLDDVTFSKYSNSAVVDPQTPQPHPSCCACSENSA
jgi:hypothetical protein